MECQAFDVYDGVLHIYYLTNEQQQTKKQTKV